MSRAGVYGGVVAVSFLLKKGIYSVAGCGFTTDILSYHVCLYCT